MNHEQRNEELLAQKTARAIESGNGQPMSTEDQQTFELGRLLRQSTAVDLPAANPQLRELLLEELESLQPEPVGLANASREFSGGRFSNRQFFSILAVAATLMLAIGIWAIYQMNPERSQTAGKLHQLQSGPVESYIIDEISWEPIAHSDPQSSASQSESSGAQGAGRGIDFQSTTPIASEETNDKSFRERDISNASVTDSKTNSVVKSENEHVNGDNDATDEKPFFESFQLTKDGNGQPIGQESRRSKDQAQSQGQVGYLPVTERFADATKEQLVTNGQPQIRGYDRSDAATTPLQQEQARALFIEAIRKQEGPAGTRSIEPSAAGTIYDFAGSQPATQQQIATNFDSISSARVFGRSPLESEPMKEAETEMLVKPRIVAQSEQKNEGVAFGLGGLGLGRGGMGGAGMGDDALGYDAMGGGAMGGLGGGAMGGMVVDDLDVSGYYSEQSQLGGGRYKSGGGRFEFESKSNAEQYIPIHENKFITAIGGDAISTFSIDVDTASYANMRRFINGGQLPPRDSVRIEELINYFSYDYPQPTGEDPFSVNMELATCPWNNNHKLLRVGLKGKDVDVNERPPTNLVFLLDVSGSMNSDDKLPLLKRGFQMMVNQLTENDQVAIVTYAGNAGVALEPTSGDQKKKINEAIECLTPGGSTHGSAGIELAYKLAQTQFVKDGVNKVILATDGDLNVGVTDDDALVKLIKDKASEGVFLTVLGFGTGNLKDGKMERLADNGNGMYAYVDSLREAHKVLVEQMSGSLVTIAKDVKIQIEFNPAEVRSYRLIGYENRMLATQDFDNDQKDAGEIGAGHTVTAIYELSTSDKVDGFTNVTPDSLKYQSQEKPEASRAADPSTNLSSAAKSGELLTLALRYKQPDSNRSKRIEFTIKNDEKSFSSASNDFRFAASVAAFGMLLRGSQHAADANAGMVLDIATGAIGEDNSGYRAEFIDLVRRVGLQTSN